MIYANIVPFVTRACLLLTVAVGASCVHEPSASTEGDDAPAENLVFGADIENPAHFGETLLERGIGVDETKEPAKLPQIIAEPVAVLPIVFQLQRETSGRAIEVAYLISETGKVSNCDVVRVGGSRDLRATLSTDQQAELCEAIEKRQYAPAATKISVSVQFGMPHLQ